MATTTNLALDSTLSSLSGGVSPTTAINEESEVTFSGVWVAGDEWTIIITDNLSGLQTQLGSGFITGNIGTSNADVTPLPDYAFTFDEKVYVLAGSNVFCSAVGDPTVFNDPNGLGNGFLELLDTYSTPENLLAMAQFQGYLAFFTRWTIQIWAISETLSQWALIQSLPNMGTIAQRSVQALGTGLDVMFLSDTGLRSLRVREVTLAGVIVDIGSPVDAFVRKALLAGNGSTACGIVDPQTGNYWCFIKQPGSGLSPFQQCIYVSSYFPSNKIDAWSTWDATDNVTGPFLPMGFVVYQGQVWVWGIDANDNPAAWQYGGSNNDTYDITVLTVITPFMDGANGKAPAINKDSLAFDVVINAEYPGLLDANNAAYAIWSMYATMDPQNVGTDNLPAGFGAQAIFVGAKATYDIMGIPYAEKGTHVSVKLVTSGTGPASLSSLTWHYDTEGPKN